MTAATKLAIIVGIFIAVLLGWAVDGYGSTTVGFMIRTRSVSFAGGASPCGHH